MYPLRFDPVVEMLEGIVGLTNVEVDVHEVGVGLVAAQIVPEGGVHGFAAFVDHALDGVQLLDAPLKRAGVAALK